MTCSTQRATNSSSPLWRPAAPPSAAAGRAPAAAAGAPAVTFIRMCSSRISMGMDHSTVKYR